MQLSLSNSKLGVEIRLRSLPSWSARFLYLLKLKSLVLVGRYLIGKGIKTDQTDWSQYKKRLLKNTDVQRFDDMLRLMVSGASQQREKFIDVLEKLHQQGVIVFGSHVTTHSLVTCMISDYNSAHVHFIDGRGGGYTMAAAQLKQQIKRLKQ